MFFLFPLLRWIIHKSGKWIQPTGNSRSVMPLNALGCTRTTLVCRTCGVCFFLSFQWIKKLCVQATIHCIHGVFLFWKVFQWKVALSGNGLVIRKSSRAGDWRLKLFAMNEECLVCASHQLAQIVSLLFVHTARRCYWWSMDRESWRKRKKKEISNSLFFVFVIQNCAMFFY